MFKLNQLGTALALAYIGHAAMAADTAPTESLERVTITGSSIKRLDSETALPVTVMTREQIQKSGAVGVEDLLRRVTASGAMTSDSTQGAGYATSNANLRGLGPNSTLILLNGRRLANHPFGSIGGTVAVDLNSIPFAAIDRIEVLRDGASAVYGSDAVGGVINFITRQDYQSGDLTIRYGDQTNGKGGREKGASLALGFGTLEKDNFNVLVTANVQRNDRLRAVEDQYYSRGSDEIPGAPPPTSGRAFPGRLVDYGLSPGAYVNTGLTNDTKLAGCDPVNTVLQNVGKTPNGSAKLRCRFIYAATLDNLPDQTKGDIYARLTTNLAKDHQFFAEASYARNHSIGRIAAVPIDSTAGHLDVATASYPSFAMPISSKYFPAALLTQLGYDPTKFATLPNGMTEIAMRAVPVGNRINDNTNTQSRWVAGLRGVFSGWDYETALTRAESKGSLDYDGYINEKKFIAALATGNLNPFGPMDQAGNDLLKSTLMVGPMRRSKSTSTTLDGKVSSDIGQLDGGAMALAVGFDFRNEKAEDHAVNDEYRQGLHIGGEGTVPDTTASRNVAGLFSELSLPFAKGWEATLAGRYDHYSDFGSTFNPRASLRWQPSKQFMMRSSVGTGFRAPSLWDVKAPNSFTNTANSAIDPQCPKGFEDDDRCNTQMNVLNSSSPNLKPEKSKQFTLGMVLEPAKWMTASLDYWMIEKTDQIGQVTGDAVLSDPALYSKYIGRVHRAANGFISYIDQPIENLGGMKTSGLDYSLKGNWNVTDLGKLRIETDGTYVINYRDQSGKDQPYKDYVGTAGDGGRVQPVPRFQSTSSIEVQRGDWSARLENVFIRGWCEQPDLVGNSLGMDPPKACHQVRDSSRWNLSTSYSGFKDLTLRLGVRNILAEAPPYTAVPSNGSHAAGYAASFVDPRGRFIYGSVNYKFR